MNPRAPLSIYDERYECIYYEEKISSTFIDM